MQASSEMPFQSEKIPVCRGLSDLLQFTEQYPNFYLCPYIADKTDEGWDSSTSRTYMNQVLPGFLYVPVNVPKEDTDGLDELLNSLKDNRRVAAVNITQPHKSNPVVRRIFTGDEASQVNIDTLIRNREGLLEPYDLNAPAFVGWYKDEVGDFAHSTVVLVGVGGVGEPMAKAIAKEAPARLILIDPNDKQQLAQQLSQQVESVEYYGSITAAPIDELGDGFILINAAGKEGADDNSGVADIINRRANQNGVFVDIRPQLDIDIVEAAKGLGWRAFTGNGMNARNDYTLLQGIANYVGLTPPSFDEFDRLVAAAS
jgi:shikimate 5-dehydrogenase